MTDPHELMLRPDYLAGLGDRSLDDVRAMRAECIGVETGLSYLRRLAQGRLDLVRRELEHRAGDGHVDARSLVEQLSEVLGDGPRSSGGGRLPQTLEPTDVDPVLAAELDGLAGGAVLNRLAELHDADLADLAGALTDLERRISERRRACFVPIDALQAEITRRYRDGEASVDTLLRGD